MIAGLQQENRALVQEKASAGITQKLQMEAGTPAIAKDRADEDVSVAAEAKGYVRLADNAPRSWVNSTENSTKGGSWRRS